MGVLKEEFTGKKLSFTFSKKTDSIRQSWILPSWLLMLVRLLLTLFCITIIIISGVREGSPKWFIYLTNWAYTLLTSAFLALSLVSILHVVEQPEKPGPSATEGRSTDVEQHRWYHKVAWYLWIIAANSAVVVTLNYWLLIFTPPTNFMDIAVHALNTVFMLIELFMGSIPVRILHGVYVAMFAAVYSIFTVVYWAAGGTDPDGNPYIYEVLDYENGNPGIVAGVSIATVIVISPLVQLVLFGLYHLRLYLHRKINYAKVDSQEGEGYNMRSI